MSEHRLAFLTRDEAAARAAAGAICIVPVGSLEQHGGHLPVGTDFLLAQEVALRAAHDAPIDIVVAPPLWTGFSPHHLRFGATVSLSPETFLRLVRETVETLRASFPRVVIVNGHGGNRGLLSSLSLELGIEIISYWELAPELAVQLFPTDAGSIGHAGQIETSLMLVLDTTQVREPLSTFEDAPAEDDLLNSPPLGTSGVIGNPQAASQDAGAEFLDRCVARLVHRLSARRDP